MGGWVVFWPWVECVVALFIYLSAIITKAKLTRIGGVELGEPQFYVAPLLGNTSSKRKFAQIWVTGRRRI